MDKNLFSIQDEEVTVKKGKKEKEDDNKEHKKQ